MLGELSLGSVSILEGIKLLWSNTEFWGMMVEVMDALGRPGQKVLVRILRQEDRQCIVKPCVCVCEGV